MNINRNTVIKGDILSKAVEYALGHLRRDMEKACAVSTIPETEICLVSEKMEEETFCLAISRNGWNSGLLMPWGLCMAFMRSAEGFWGLLISGFGMTR